MGRLRYPYRWGSRFPARRPDHYTLDPYLVLDIPFHEGSGSLVEDRSIHKNIGTILDGTWKAQGIIGPCLEFDGEDDYVDCGNDTSLDITEAITIEAWVKASTFPESNVIVAKGGYEDGYRLRFYSDTGKFNFIMDELAGYTVISSQVASADTWYYIESRWSTEIGKMEIYINGSKDPNTYAKTDDIKTNTTSLKLGTLTVSIYLFHGLIDQVRVLARALSAQEILDRYERTKR